MPTDFPVRILAAGAAVAVLVGSAACFEEDEFLSSGPGGSTPAGQEVAVRDNFFEPAGFQVEVGEGVQWAWEGENEHNVTFVDPMMGNSATQSEGTFSKTFSAAGDYPYYCTIHGTPTSGMRGSVTVGEGDVDTTTTGY